MHAAASRFLHLAELVRVRNAERLFSSTIIAILIALLIWQTKWPALRSGLAVLLFAQVALPVSLLFQNRRISLALARWSAIPPAADAMLSWFEEQERFLRASAKVENFIRFVGFGLLAYGFWVSTRSLWLTLALGLLYPLFIYFGVVRGNQSRALKALGNSRDEIRELLGARQAGVQSKRAG